MKSLTPLLLFAGCHPKDTDTGPEEHPCETLSWYLDSDGDGFGNRDELVESCDEVGGYVLPSNDCDDGDATLAPGMDEICGDGLDNDCNGRADDGACDTGLGEREGWFCWDDAELCEVKLVRSHVEYEGAAAGSYSGWSLAYAGDVNADGTGDFLVGAPLDSPGAYASGTAYLVLGLSEGQLDLDRAEAAFRGGEIYEYMGISVAGPGDLNDDGYDDVLVGGYYTGAGLGGVYVHLGPVAGDIEVGDEDGHIDGVSGDMAGWSMKADFDYDEDGNVDLLIGATGSDTVYMLTGPLTADTMLASAEAQFEGNSGENTGVAVDALGDIDGDGVMDVAIGAQYNSDVDYLAGMAFIVHGPLAGTMSLSDADGMWAGDYMYAFAGNYLCGPGDMDGDGLDDVVVSAPYGEYFFGASYVLLGPATGASLLTDGADYKLMGSTYYEYAAATTPAGDIDRDGLADVLVALSGDSTENDGAGAVYVVSGARLQNGWVGDSAEVVFVGDDAGEAAGQNALDSDFDLDGDGATDLLVGSVGHDGGRGTSYMVLGREL